MNTPTIKLTFSLVITLLLVSSCQRETRTQFTILNAGLTGLDFNPLSKKTNPNDNDIKEFGNSVAVGDLNNDGLQDLLLSGIYSTPQLYLNKGNLTFENITYKAGITIDNNTRVFGASIIDINNDGRNDICIAVYESDISARQNHMLLYINKGNNTFTEESKNYNLALNGQGTMPYFFDFDKDGDIDLFYISWPFFNSNPFDINYLDAVKKDTVSTYNRLMRNDNGKFIDVTAESGLSVIPAVTNSAIITDVNNDGWQDIYVCNDFIYPDRLFINNQGHFTETTTAKISKGCLSSMGSDCADINNDGFPEIMVVDMLSPGHYRRKMNTLALTTGFYEELVSQSKFAQYQRNTLQINNAGENFSESSFLYDIAQTEWSWSPLFSDFNNDGWKDLFVSCGSRKELTNMDHISNYTNNYGTYDPVKQWVLDWREIPSYPYHNFIYQNNEGNGFTDKTESWGITGTTNSEGAAYADFDNDGDVDLVVCNTNTTPYLLRNNNNTIHPNSNYLRIKLKSTNSINFALGAKVYLYTGNTTQYQEAISTKGYLSVSENVLHFGLGQFTTADSIKIIWPSGKGQVLTNVKAKQVITALEKEAVTVLPLAGAKLFTGLRNESSEENTFLHTEDNFDDFRRDKIIPHRVSKEGPAIAVADVDNDGDEDYYISGAKGQKGKLFIQNAEGNFKSAAVAFTETPNLYDESCVTFADIDGNGLVDLISGKGSNGDNLNDTLSQHLSIWLNNGALVFSPIAASNLPIVVNPIGTISAADYDKDGDIDLFVGGRIIPGKFGVSPRSYLLENRKRMGMLVDVTAQSAPQLMHLGMVTASAFADIDNDKTVDLIVAGEFLPVSIFKNIQGSWKDVTANTRLSNTNGLWSCLELNDIDNDGDIDIIAGNWGLNSIWRASLPEPLSLWVNDFDENGSIDPVLFHYLEHVNAPFVNRDLFCKQMPKFFNRFNNYESYAMATDKNIFSAEQIKSATVLNAYTLKTSLFINNGKGLFTYKELPAYLQIAPVKTLVIHDFDKNGTKDLLALGNTNSNFYDQGAIDALRGKVFFGNGKGDFSNGELVSELNKATITSCAKLVTNKKTGLKQLVVSANSDSSSLFTIIP